MVVKVNMAVKGMGQFLAKQSALHEDQRTHQQYNQMCAFTILLPQIWNWVPFTGSKRPKAVPA